MNETSNLTPNTPTPSIPTSPNPENTPSPTSKEAMRQRFEDLTNTVPVLEGTKLPAQKENENINLDAEKGKKGKKEQDLDIFDAAENHSKVNENEWAWGENLKGEGDRPDWMKKEFKSVEAQAKAYNDLVKKFGSFHGAPEAYDYSKVENSAFHVHPEAENAKKFAQIGKELNLSQDGFNKILDFFNKTVAPTFKTTGEKPIDSRAEIAKLGEDGPQQVQVLNQWLQNNFTDDYHELRGMMKNANQIKAFMKVRSRMLGGMSNSALYHENQMVSHDQMQRNLRHELAEAKKSNDPNKRKMVFEKYKQVFDDN